MFRRSIQSSADQQRGSHGQEGDLHAQSSDMARSLSADEIEQMSIEERLQLVEKIWNSIASHPDSLPVSEHDRRELHQALTEYRANPSDTRSWEEVRDELFPKR